MSYSYFAATLPMIQLESNLHMKTADFIELCREHLSLSDFEVLTALLNGEPSGNAFVNKWQNVYNQIRNAIARLRASKAGVSIDVSKWLKEYHGFSVYAENAVVAAFQEKDPMQREELLDRLYWNVAEEIAGFDPFSADAIFAYGIKLRILEKRASIHLEEGEKRMREISKETE